MVQITNRDHLGRWPVLSLYDRDGKVLIKDRPIVVENATEIVVNSATVTLRGSILLAARMSEYAVQAESVILSVSQEEVEPRVVESSPDPIPLVHGAEDGSVWAFKALAYTGASGIRSMQGEQARGGLPLVTQSPSKIYLISAGYQADPVAESKSGSPAIGSSKDRTGVFLPSEERWIEFDRLGRIVEDFSVATPRYVGTDAPVGIPLYPWKELGMLTSGRVYALFGPTPRHAQKNVGPQIGFYQLDRVNRQWVLAQNSSSEFRGIYGTDGDYIIRRKNDSFAWVTLPDAVKPLPYSGGR